MGKIIAELSPGQSAGHDPWAWGSKCRPRRAGITGWEVPWEPKNCQETRKMTIIGPQNSYVKWCQKRE